MSERCRMKERKALLFCSLLLICLSGCGNTQEPHLVLSHYQYDLGRVKRGQIYNGEIYVYNRGGAMLEINRCQADCNCAQVSINKRQIDVGDSAILRFFIDTKNKVGETTNIIFLEANTDSLVHYAEIHATVED